ncbi:MAG: hypothetical protein HZB76_06560, partial [Chlamydiae bacterium]|nr:hypothetical protein [Chlamydiota bacterium]
ISATGGDITGSISTHSLLTSTTNGQSSISAAGNINFSTLGATTLTGSAANTAFIQATGGSNGISFNSSGPNFGSITLNNNSFITAPGNISCYLAGASAISSGAQTSYIASTAGSVTINNSSSLTLTAGTSDAYILVNTGSINLASSSISLNGSATNQAYIKTQGAASSNQPITLTASGDITLNTNSQIFTQNGGAITINANNLTLNPNVNPPGDPQIQTGSLNGTGNISITTGNNITLNQGVILANSDITLIAGNNIFLDPSSTITTPDGTITLVVDNDFPEAPFFGQGKLTLTSSSNLSAPVIARLYTSERQLNSLPSIINGGAYSPGPVEVDTSFEKWGFYYSAISTPEGPNFVIYYKFNFNNTVGHFAFDIGLTSQEMFYRIYNSMRDYIVLDPIASPFKKFIEQNKLYCICKCENNTKNESLCKTVKEAPTQKAPITETAAYEERVVETKVEENEPIQETRTQEKTAEGIKEAKTQETDKKQREETSVEKENIEKTKAVTPWEYLKEYLKQNWEKVKQIFE